MSKNELSEGFNLAAEQPSPTISSIAESNSAGTTIISQPAYDMGFDERPDWPKPNYSYWFSEYTIKPFELAALSMAVDPTTNVVPSEKGSAIVKRLEEIVAAQKRNELTSPATLKEFYIWAVSRNYRLPTELTENFASENEESTEQSDQVITAVHSIEVGGPTNAERKSSNDLARLPKQDGRRETSDATLIVGMALASYSINHATLKKLAFGEVGAKASDIHEACRKIQQDLEDRNIKLNYKTIEKRLTLAFKHSYLHQKLDDLKEPRKTTVVESQALVPNNCLEEAST